MRLLVLWLCFILAIIPSARVIPVAAAPEVAAPAPFPITHEGHFGGHVRIVKVEGQTAYLAEGNYFTILDLRALPQIAPLASLPLTGPVYDLAIAGARAYLAVENVGLVVVNIADLQQPSVIATVPLSGASTPDDVEVAGTIVYVRTRGDGLRIYDLQTPGAPAQLGHYAAQFDQLSPGTTLARHGTTLYAVTNTLSIRGVHVIDASNPRAPSLARIIPSSEDGVALGGVAVSDGRLYVSGSPSLRIFGLTTPTNPNLLGTLERGGSGGVSVVNQRAYLTHSGLVIVDVSTPSSPQVLGSLDMESNWLVYAHAFGTTVLVAEQDRGLTLVDASDPTAPHIIDHSYKGGQSVDLDVKGSMAYVATPNGLQILDISDRSRPRLRSVFGQDVVGVKVDGTRAYLSILPLGLAGGFVGLQVVDVRNPDQPVLLGSFPAQAATWRLDVVGTRVYLLDWYGIDILDVSDPAAIRSIKHEDSFKFLNNIVIAGERVYAISDWWVMSTDLDGEDLQAYLLGNDCGGVGLDVVGSLVYAADGRCGLFILDTSDPTGEGIWREMAHLPIRASDVRVAGGVALVSDSATGALTAVDVSNPAQPVIRDRAAIPGWGSDIEVQGDRVFVGGINNGMQIFKLPFQFTYLPFARQQ